jgi:hypothetical protein
MRHKFLPPYSPDFNPIEPAFSAIKAHICHNGGLFRAATESQDNKAAVLTQLHDADDARGWFHHCGYLYSFDLSFSQMVDGFMY